MLDFVDFLTNRVSAMVRPGVSGEGDQCMEGEPSTDHAGQRASVL